mgnify:CR=1 FL=1
MDENRSFDVIIIGLGPVGAVVANLLAPFNISILIIEKNKMIHPTPRAIHFDGEVMRIFQNIGLSSYIKKIARPSFQGMHFVDKNNKTLLVRKANKDIGDQGWYNNWYFFQPELEKILRNGLNRFNNVSFRLGENLIKIKDFKNNCILTTNCGVSNKKKSYLGKWIIGCDGTKSLVSNKISKKVTDFGFDEKWLVIDLNIKKNSVRAKKLPNYTVQHCNPIRPMTRCCISSSKRRWEIKIHPNDDLKKILQKKFLWSILSPWLTPDDAEIERAQIYTFHSIIKNKWRKNNMVIAGDSAHQSPPFLGQGLCAGIRDASSLAWRLARIINGRADNSLLDSYTNERKKHVLEFIKLATRCGELINTGKKSLINKYFNSSLKENNASFNYPKPQLGKGVWEYGKIPLGQITPQFFFRKRLLDDKAIYKFILLENCNLKNNLQNQDKKLLKEFEIIIISANKEIKSWLKTINAHVALIRPDRYLYGVANNYSETTKLLNSLRDKLGPK